MITGSKKQQILPEHVTVEADVDHADSTSQFTPVFTPEQHVGTALRHTFRAFADAVSENLLPLGLNLNMWFVLATEKPERKTEVIAAIEASTGLKVHDMPKLAEYHVGLRLEV